MSKANYIIGETYGDGNILLELLPNRGQYRFGMFRCKCGNIFTARITAITSGNSKGCGCREGTHMKTHGLSKTQLYEAWCNIKKRCYNRIYPKYNYWGGRGITMSDEFLNSPETFVEYMKSLPNYDKREELKLEIDRINNDGNYERGNLRWATRSEQCSNRRSWTIDFLKDFEITD